LIPSSPADDRALIYPVGAVDYLRESGFEGNLLTPFEVGAFVSWNLYPRVLVSMDGRFEVAYAPELLERHLRFFGANEGWQAFLNEIPARAVLVESTVPVAERMRGLAGWRAVYRDDAYEVFERDTGQVRPMVDRRGIPLTGRFP
jgi:hypothetical protein